MHILSWVLCLGLACIAVTAPPPSVEIDPKQYGQCSCGVRNANGASRIVGGRETYRGEIPWRVAVFVYEQSSGQGSICGGTIISPNWILTAAHCTMDFQAGVHAVDVYAGAQENPVTVGGGTPIQADYFVQHELFNRNNLDNDIALVHLAQPFRFSKSVSPACLPFGQLARADFTGSAIASGWGTTNPVPVDVENHDPSSDTLKIVELPLLTTAQCSRYIQVTRNQICTYQEGIDSCQGDSGGSIDWLGRNRLYYAIGVVSFGFGCAQRNQPGVYTKVNNYLDWIQATTQENFCMK